MDEYNLDIQKAIEKIQKEKAKLACIQLPDGLKPKAKDIQMKIEEKTDAKVIIWLGSCFGSCDIPARLEELNVDLLIQWGHSSNFPYFKD